VADTLGELDVLISADWSDLQSAIDDAVKAAETGAEAIQEAFSDSATFDAMTHGLEGLTEALGGVSEAASGTVSGIGEAGDAAGEASSQLELFGSSAGSAGEQLSLFGDAVDESSGGIGQLGDDSATAADSLSTLGDSAGETESSLSSLGDATTEAADSLSTVDDASASAGDSLTAVDSAASSAGDSFTVVAGAASEAQPAIEGAGTASEEAEGGLAGMVEQLTLLGEALVITEGLKEFGEEALNAYGTVQSVTIGLTALTKSATDADEIVGQIKDLAATEPFAFPEIAPTIQRMVAMGVSADQVNAAMHAVADASAATGNAFSGVANMFDRMSISGMANARTMATLGISLQNLGDAMGVTASEAASAFKALDQEDRITALDTALGKFAGTAEAEAQGIAGQWQIFQNQFEEVMVSVGQALAPVVGDILSFGKSAMAAIEPVAEAFEALPEPVKDVMVAVGLLVAAVVPLTALLSTVGLGMIGLQQVLPTVSGLLASFGTASDEAAAAEATLGTNAVTAGTEIEGLGGIALTAKGEMVQLGAAGVAASEGAGSMAIGMGPLGIAIGGVTLAATLLYGELQKDLKAMNDLAAATPATPAQAQSIQNLTTALTAYNQQALLAGKQQIPIPNWNPATQTLDQYVTALQKAATGITFFGGAAGTAKAQLDALSAGGAITIGRFGDMSAAAQAAQAALAKTDQTVSDLQAKLTTAQGALVLAKQGFADGAVTAAQLAAAQTAVTKATSALDAELGIHANATDKASASLDKFNASQQKAGDITETFAQQVQAGVDAILNSQNKLDAQLEVAAGVWVAMSTSATASSADVEAAQKKLDAAVKATGDDFVAEGAAIVDAMKQQGVTVTSLIQQYEDLATSGDASAKDIAQALNIVQVAAHATGMSMTDLVTAINTVPNAVDGMGAAIVNGKLQIVGLADAAVAAGPVIKGAIQPATQAFQDFGATASSILGLTGAALTNWTAGTVIGMAKVTGAVQNASTAFGNAGGGLTYATSAAGSALQGYANNANAGTQATQNASTAFGNAGGGLTYATSAAGSALQGYANNANAGTQATTELGNALVNTGDAYDAIVEAGDSAATSTDDVTQSYNYATSAANQLTAANTQLAASWLDVADAEAEAQGSGGGGGETNYALAYAQAVSPFAVSGTTQFVPGLFGGMSGEQPGGYTSNPSANVAPTVSIDTSTKAAIDGLNTSVSTLGNSAATTSTKTTATATTLSSLLTALESTATSANNLSYALTGGSLAPSLDTTTESASNLDSTLQDTSSKLGDVGASIVKTTTSATDLNDSLSTLNVVQGALNNTTIAGGETIADLQTSLGQVNDQFQAAQAASYGYALQLSALDNAGKGSSAAAKDLTDELNQENEAAANLQQAQSTITDQIIALENAANATATATGNLTSTITNLGNASSKTSTTLGSGGTGGGTATAAPDSGYSATQPSGTPNGPNGDNTVIDTPEGVWNYFPGGAGQPAGWYLSAVTSQNAPYTSVTGSATQPSAGDPFSESQIAALASGASVASGALTEQQDAAIAADVAAYIAAHPQAQPTTSANAPYTQSTGNATQPSAGDPFSEAQIAALASGQSVQSGALTESQDAAIAADVAAYVAAHPGTEPTASEQWSGTGNIPAPGTYPAGYSNSSPSATFGTNGPASSFVINISGMTPANAQQVLGQMTTALRLAGAKIT
jgi:trimeric autotransporter adhesin